MRPTRVLESCLYVDDLDEAVSFYRDVLGLELIEVQPERHCFFRCGRQMVLLFNADASAVEDGEIPPHGARGPGHLAFASAPDDLAAWRNRLEQAGIPIEQTIEWPQGGRSLYFRDPAGNSLEFATPRIWGLS